MLSYFTDLPGTTAARRASFTRWLTMCRSRDVVRQRRDGWSEPGSVCHSDVVRKLNTRWRSAAATEFFSNVYLKFCIFI